MSKKTSSIASANGSHPPPQQHQTGFTTADKLVDFDPNFTPDFDPQNEAKKRSTKTIYNQSIKPTSEDPTEAQKPSVQKEVPNRSIKQHRQTRKTTKKTECAKRSTKSIYKAASADSKNNKKKPEMKKEVPNRSKLSNLSNTSKRSKEVQDQLEQYKRSTNQSNSDTRYLSIITLLNYGLRPSEISTESGVPKTTLQHHLNYLKEQGLIHKAGYGVWVVSDTPEITKKRSTKSIYVAKNTPPSEVRQNLHMFIPDSVRAHAFLFTLQVPHDLHNWNNEKREQYLDRHNIPYKRLGIINGGQRLIINGRKTHLTDKSIVIYDRSSYFAEKAIEAKSDAVHSFISIIKKLERTLHVELTSGSDYKFRVSRQHYALVKNAIAQQCNAEGLKLEVRSEADNSLWFLIDNSFNLDEAEAVHPKTGMTDVQKVQNFFNGVKETGITPSSILEEMNSVRDIKELQNTSIQIQATMVDQVAGIVGNQQSITGNQMAMAANTESHLGLISNIDTKIHDLGAGIKDMTTSIQTFNSLLEKLFKKLEGDQS